MTFDPKFSRGTWNVKVLLRVVVLLEHVDVVTRQKNADDGDFLSDKLHHLQSCEGATATARAGSGKAEAC